MSQEDGVCHMPLPLKPSSESKSESQDENAGMCCEQKSLSILCERTGKLDEEDEDGGH